MSAIITYIIGSLGLIVKPGPDLLCTVATALSHGKGRAVLLMSGLILGCWIWILLLALGAAAFLEAHGAIMTVVRIVGMSYIGYLAFGCLREAWVGYRSSSGLQLAAPQECGSRLLVRGVLMSMSNPLTIIFFLAFLPHFTNDGSSLSPGVQVLLLGTLFCALVPFVYIPIIFAADTLKTTLERKPSFAPTVKLVSGLMLVAVVVLLLG
mgnify:CR=1 FL=1